MSRIATNIIEVRDGAVKNYMGDYSAYLYSIEKEIEEGERRRNANKTSKTSEGKSGGKGQSHKESKDLQKLHRKRQKEIKRLEKEIAELDVEKKQLNQQLMETTDPDEALKLHSLFTDVSDRLGDAEERWLELTEEN